MLTPEPWIERLRPDERGLVATPEQIAAFNRENARLAGSVVDLATYPERWGRTEVVSKVRALSKPHGGRRFKDGQEVGPEYFARLASNLGLEALPESGEVRWGLVVRRAALRNFPTADKVFDTADGYELDRFMETTAYVGEGIAVLAESTDKRWVLGQIQSYLAWIEADAVAIGPRSVVLDYVASRDLLVVTGKESRTNHDPLDPRLSEVPLYMGMRLPLAAEIPELVDGQPPNGNHVVKLPVRGEGGALEIRPALVSRSADAHVGFLPFTRENVIRQAFKLQGTRYGWGGSFNGVDCSSFLMEIHKTFGLVLPRNSGEQANKTVGRGYPLPAGASVAERRRILDQAKVGAALWMPGHIMLYLGKRGDEPFVIHAFTGFGRKRSDGEQEVVRQQQVAVTPLSILSRTSPKTYLEEVQLIRQLEPR